MTLTIPTDMAAWDPRDVADWAASLADDPEVTGAEHDQAQRAVTAALLGEDLAADIHGPATT